MFGLQKKNFNIRAEGLFKILEELSPDMICLQEIIPNWIRLVVQLEWARKNYYLSDMTGSTTFPYGVMMMIRRNNGLIIPNLRLHEMPSNMGRRFLEASFPFVNKEVTDSTDSKESKAELCVGTVHLESLNNSEFRVAQMESIFPILEEKSDVHLLMGDFNFGPNKLSYPKENTLLTKQKKKGWCDTWEILKASGSDPMYRIDRIIYRNSSLEFDLVPELIHWIGNTEIKGVPRGIYPSDHYGLYSVFKIRSPPIPYIPSENLEDQDESPSSSSSASSTSASSSSASESSSTSSISSQTSSGKSDCLVL